MKTRSLFLTLTLGLVAGLFACQDGGVTAPDDLQPQFARGGKKPPSDPPPAGIELTGVLVAEADNGLSWDFKKGVFRANGSFAVHTDFGNPDFSIIDCFVRPGDDYAAAAPLEALLRAGLTGKAAVFRVDKEGQREASDVNRITSNVGDEAVRYFWIGPWGEFDDGDPNTTDATVSDFVETDETITYRISGGVIGARDDGSPSRALKVACTYTGYVDVTLNKNSN